MSTTNDPDAIRADIERTRAQLSDDVNALADQTNPRTVAENQVQKVKDKVSGVKESVFGAPDDPWDDGKVGQARDSVADRVHGVADTVSEKTQDLSARRATRGHPLAAGLIAFGIGALIGGAAPSSRQEQRAATALKDKAQPLVSGVGDAAKESLQNLKEPAQQAAAELKDHAAAAGEAVKQQVSDESSTVKDQVASSKEQVAGAAQGQADSSEGGGQAGWSTGSRAGHPITDPTFADEPVTEDERHLFQGQGTSAPEERAGRFIEDPLDVRPDDTVLDPRDGRADPEWGRRGV